MRPPTERFRRRLASVLAVLAVVAAAGAFGAPAAGQPPPAAFAQRPGYVDFGALGLDLPPRAALTVTLHGPLLTLVAEATRGEDPELAALFDKLEGITARIFELDPATAAALARRAGPAARQLERRGWQTAVEVVSADGEIVLIQVRPDGRRLAGLSVMFVEPSGDAGFINIVGDVSPAEIGRLGARLDIEPLERIGRESARGKEKK